MDSTDFLKNVQKSMDKSLDDIRTFLDTECKKYSKEKSRIYAEHDIDNTLRFNFFESISDTWYRENFHSDILYTMLNPCTAEIGREYFVEELVKFLGIGDRFDCTKDFEVTREEGKVDLLIKNDEQAIIIENKINYAPDMENQLVRYMKYVDEELGIKTYTVVYLTLINDKNKKPPLDFGKDFKKYADMLKDKNSGILKEVYAVDDKKGLAKHLLPRFCERLQEEQEQSQSQNVKDACNMASVYINQYKMLLEHLGGKVYMKSADKKLIEEIYSSQEKFDAANDFAELWKEKDDVIGTIVKEKFSEKFGEDRKWVELKKIKGYKLYCWNSNFKDALIYYGDQQMGFVSQEGKKFSKVRQEELASIVKKIKNKDGEVWKEDEWVWCDIKHTPTFFDDIIVGLKILFEAK